MFCIWETGCKVHLENKTCKIKKGILEKVWVHMRERREREREEKKRGNLMYQILMLIIKLKYLKQNATGQKKQMN